MFNILQQIIKVILRHFPNVSRVLTQRRAIQWFVSRWKTRNNRWNHSMTCPMRFRCEYEDIQSFSIIACRGFLGESIEISLAFSTLHSDSTFWKLSAGQRGRGRWRRQRWSVGDIESADEVPLETDQRCLHLSWEWVSEDNRLRYDILWVTFVLDSVDISYNCKLRLKSCACWRFPKSFIVLLQVTTWNCLLQQR